MRNHFLGTTSSQGSTRIFDGYLGYGPIDILGFSVVLVRSTFVTEPSSSLQISLRLKRLG
jgi:hypothetical protein